MGEAERSLVHSQSQRDDCRAAARARLGHSLEWIQDRNSFLPAIISARGRLQGDRVLFSRGHSFPTPTAATSTQP